MRLTKTNPVAGALSGGRQGKPATHKEQPSHAYLKGRRRHPKHKGKSLVQRLFDEGRIKDYLIRD